MTTSWQPHDNFILTSSSWQHHDNIMTTSWQPHDNNMTISWQYHDNIILTSWQYHDNIILTSCQPEIEIASIDHFWSCLLFIRRSDAGWNLGSRWVRGNDFCLGRAVTWLACRHEDFGFGDEGMTWPDFIECLHSWSENGYESFILRVFICNTFRRKTLIWWPHFGCSIRLTNLHSKHSRTEVFLGMSFNWGSQKGNEQSIPKWHHCFLQIRFNRPFNSRLVAIDCKSSCI